MILAMNGKMGFNFPNTIARLNYINLFKKKRVCEKNSYWRLNIILIRLSTILQI